MFSLSEHTYKANLCLNYSTNPDNFVIENILYFDNDGFELTGLEKEFYKDNGIELSNCLNHEADQKTWFICNDDHFIVDHSLLLQRWEFNDEAKEQIYRHVNKFPQLNKYLRLKAKWGYDFLLEYINGYDVLEVMHIEADFRNFEQALVARGEAELKILSTDWKDFTKSLIRNKNKWEYLPGMEQNDWKASFWGLKKAEFTQKAFA